MSNTARNSSQVRKASFSSTPSARPPILDFTDAYAHSRNPQTTMSRTLLCVEALFVGVSTLAHDDETDRLPGCGASWEMLSLQRADVARERSHANSKTRRLAGVEFLRRPLPTHLDKACCEASSGWGHSQAVMMRMDANGMGPNVLHMSIHYITFHYQYQHRIPTPAIMMPCL